MHNTYICLFSKWNIVLWNMSKCVLAVPLAPENTFYVESLVGCFSLLLNKGCPRCLNIPRSSQYEFSIKFQTLSNCCLYILNLTDWASHSSWKLYASSWSCIHRSFLLDVPLWEIILFVKITHYPLNLVHPCKAFFDMVSSIQISLSMWLALANNVSMIEQKP